MKPFLTFLFSLILLTCFVSSNELDKPIDAAKSFKVEFLFEGWHNQFSGQNMMGLANIIKNAFGDNGQFQVAINYFMQSWPQGSEIMALNNVSSSVNANTWSSYSVSETALVNSQGSDYWYDATKIAQSTDYYLDEYGQVTQTNNAEIKNRWNTSYETLSEPATKAYISSGRWANTPSNYVHAGSNHYIDAINIYIDGQKYTIQDQVNCSPIVLDMDGDGKLEASNGQWLPHQYNGGKLVKFDIDGDGFVDMTEWVGPNDGLLIVYKSQEIVTGHDLFGDADGFLNGYFKLQLLDTNKDGKLSGDELKNLSVWQDKNMDAKIDSGEVKTLKELEIETLHLNHKNLHSTFIQGGKTKSMWDWYPSTFAIRAKE